MPCRVFLHVRSLASSTQSDAHGLIDSFHFKSWTIVTTQFAGNCTADLKFYDSLDDYNYKRAVTWSIVMTWLTHVHPSFTTVFSLGGSTNPSPILHRHLPYLNVQAILFLTALGRVLTKRPTAQITSLSSMVFGLSSSPLESSVIPPLFWVL